MKLLLDPQVAFLFGALFGLGFGILLLIIIGSRQP